MVHLMLVNVASPANAQFFFSALLSLVAYNLIDITEPLREAFGLYDETLINEHFAELGYVSNAFIINMGNLFVAMIIFALLHVFRLVTRSATSPWLVKVRDFLTKDLVWNNTIALLIESFLVTAISCFINIRSLSWETKGLGLNSTLALIASISIIGLPVFSILWIRRNKEELDSVPLKERFGKLYMHLAYKKGGIVLWEPFIFMSRIIILALTLVFLADFPYFQIFFINMQVTAVVVYNGWYTPFSTKQQAFFDTLNECFISIILYHLIAFADLIQDEPTRTFMGWSLVIAISFSITCNLGSLL
jgi:hypothetical protein